MTIPFKIGGEQRVHEFQTGQQSGPATMALPSGRSVVLWTDVSGAGAQIRGRLLAEDGTAGAEFAVSDTATSASAATVTELADGRFAVAFLSERGSSAQDVRVRFFDADGNASGASHRVALTDGSGRISVREPALLTLDTGEVLVAVRGLAGSQSHVFGAIYNADGTPKGTAFSLESGAGLRSQPQLVARDGGGFVAVWQETVSGLGEEIRGRAYTSTGTPMGPAFAINQDVSGNQVVPAAARLADGNIMVVWSGPVTAGSGVRGVVIDGDGQNVVKEFTIDTAASGAGPREARLAVLNDGRVLVVWSTQTNDDNLVPQDDIRARLLFASGLPASVEFSVPNSPASHAKFDPDVTVLPSGLIRVVWRTSDPLGSGDTIDVSTQLLDPRIGVVATIDGKDTAPQRLDPFDMTAILAEAALTVVGSPGIAMGNERATNGQVIVDGSLTVLSVFEQADAVHLTGTTTGTAAGFGNHRLSVGETGAIRSTAGDGVVFQGRGNSMVQSGRIEARLDAVDATGNGFVLTNLGTLLGATGLRVTGDGFDLNSSGSITGTATGVVLSGSLGRLGNTGTILGQTGVGIDSQADTLSLTNSGRIEGFSAALRHVGGLLTLDNSGVMVSGSNAIDGSGSGGRITNAGRIEGDNAAISYTNSPVLGGDRLTILNTGELLGGGIGIRVTGKTIDVINTGGITAGVSFGLSDAGIFASHGGRIINHGEVSAPGFAVRASFTAARDGYTDNAADTVLRNAGTISGDVATGLGIDELHNTGLLNGIVDLGGAADFLRNTGLIDGRIRMGDGGDKIVNRGLLAGTVDLGGGNDTYEGSGTGAATVVGGAGSDRLTGGQGDDSLDGGSGADIVQGGKGDDTLIGDTGNDLLSGGSGDDVIRPGMGTDQITTGAGADVIVFASAAEIGKGSSSNTVTDFTPGQDRIDLSAVASGQTFIGGAGFSGVAGEVRYVAATGRLQGDVDGDGVLDFQLLLVGAPGLGAGDLIL